MAVIHDPLMTAYTKLDSAIDAIAAMAVVGINIKTHPFEWLEAVANAFRTQEGQALPAISSTSVTQLHRQAWEAWRTIIRRISPHALLGSVGDAITNHITKRDNPPTLQTLVDICTVDSRQLLCIRAYATGIGVDYTHDPAIVRLCLRLELWRVLSDKLVDERIALVNFITGVYEAYHPLDITTAGITDLNKRWYRGSRLQTSSNWLRDIRQMFTPTPQCTGALDAEFMDAVFYLYAVVPELFINKPVADTIIPTNVNDQQEINQ